ncbi:MAG: metalloregulator ArsR/SmtB family transcription factor [Gemmatimonadaceae bacterium]
MTMAQLDLVYSALADPTRRAILASLSSGDRTVGALAATFPISLNAVSKHVKVLERAGLVTRRVDGREHQLRLRAMPLRAAARWLEDYRMFWEDRLNALAQMLAHEDATTQPRTRGRRRT